MRTLRLGAVVPLILTVVGVLIGCHRPAGSVTRPADDHLFRPTAKPVISSPVAWDVDGDGVKEIAIGSWDGYFYLLDAGLEDLPGWPKYSPKGFFASPTLADLDGTSEMEILVTSESGEVFAWHADGTAVAGFPVDLGYQSWTSPVIVGRDRIAVGGLERMVLLDAQGRHVDGWPRPMPGWADATATTDGEILAITSLTPGDPSHGWASAWTVEGEPLPGFPIKLSKDSDSSPALTDFGEGLARWLVFGDDDGYLHVVDLQGRPREGFPVRSQGAGPGPTPTPHPPGGNIHSIEASPAIADLNGSGTHEIVVGSWDARLYVWDAAGEPMPGWPIEVGDQIISSAALVDLDGDDRLDIVVGSKDGHLYGWTTGGVALEGFPRALGAPVFSSPWVGDLDGNGRADIVVGADNGIHLLRDVAPLGRAAWPMFHRDARRTGWAGE